MSDQKILEVLAKYPVSQQRQILHKMKQELFRDSLYLYAKHICGYDRMTDETHGPICGALECPETKRKLIVVPRGTFKSSIGSVAYPMWLLERDPNLRIMLDSELYSNSKNLLREIKAHYQSEKYTSVFGAPTFDIWNEGEIQWTRRSIAKKEPSIVCSGVGAQKTGQHYDVIVADDLNSPGNTKNPDVAESVRNHFRYYTSILEPGGIIVVIATRYSELDVIQMILDNELKVDADFLLNQRGLLHAGTK